MCIRDSCKEVVRLGNIAFMLSIEVTPETNDARRGEGHYAAVMNAMDLLKKYGIIFGTSICYTRDNIEAVTNDEFMRFLCEKGAHLSLIHISASLALGAKWAFPLRNSTPAAPWDWPSCAATSISSTAMVRSAKAR